MIINKTDYWPIVKLVRVEPGAQYEGLTYDQDLIVETRDGELLTLFDMSPMIGVELKPGRLLEILVSITSPQDIRINNSIDAKTNCGYVSNIGTFIETNYWHTIRENPFINNLYTITTASGNFIISQKDINNDALDNLALDTILCWKNARLDLIAWNPAPNPENSK